MSSAAPNHHTHKIICSLEMSRFIYYIIHRNCFLLHRIIGFLLQCCSKFRWGGLALIVTEHVNTSSKAGSSFQTDADVWGGFCRGKLGFFKIWYNLNPAALCFTSHMCVKGMASSTGISQSFCTRGSDKDIMWWAAENWTEYIHPKPLGYHIQPWPIP